MVTGVEIEFPKEPDQIDIQAMKTAALKLAKDPVRIEIKRSNDSPNKATAIFRMKNAAQYKVVGIVADRFKIELPDYIDMAIWFRQEKAYDLETSDDI